MPFDVTAKEASALLGRSTLTISRDRRESKLRKGKEYILDMKRWGYVYDVAACRKRLQELGLKVSPAPAEEAAA